MLRYFFLYFLFFKLYSTNAQNYILYYNSINKAKYYEKEGRSQEALNIYTITFSKYLFVPNKHLWRAIIVANEVSNQQVARAFLTQLLAQSDYDCYIWYLREAKRLFVFRNDTTFQLTTNCFQPKFNNLYKEKINELYLADQRCRTENTDAFDYYIKIHNSVNYTYDTVLYMEGKKAVERMIVTDSLNFFVLKQIYQQTKTILDQRDIDARIASYQSVLLAHSGKNTIKYLQLLMYKSLINGKIDPSTFAWVTDRASKENSNESIYYWDILNYKNNINLDISILSKKKQKKINKRRKKIGLPLLPETMLSYRD